MATKQLVDNFLNDTVDLPQIALSAPSGNSVAIDSFTVANNSTVNASYKAYIKSSAGVLSPQIPFKVVVWGENDLGIGIVNQVIPAGGSLQVESSALNSLYFTVSGRELS
ncbi:MAG: hypothetical protein HRU18_00930 [Pseudoalteromonas sp.]|uniref:hypothetical protein n=1 Tax=Pseudoalteromonas sp. TaxID=53249 RepID=UPI001D1C3F33|nr:hypothetical protein [Pseudoalteromonas sp.]NRA76744.1 hypothetical protein [Pseudoalteromonas sp.]